MKNGSNKLKTAVVEKSIFNNEAVVLGNGPSLRGFDFKRLNDFDVFGMNVAYRYWHEIGWFPQYYSCLDLVVGEFHRRAIAELIQDSERLGIRGFLLRHSTIEKLGKEGDSPKVFNFDLLRPGFECWIPSPVTTGSHTCAWASLLGYRNIYLLGIDCNYVEIISNAKQHNGSILEIVADAPNPNYFFDSYQRKGDRYNLPNPRKDLHLESWRCIGEKIKSRSRVLNANLASRVDAFPFVRFSDIEKGGRVPLYSASMVLGGAFHEAPCDYIPVPSGKYKKLNVCNLSSAEQSKARSAGEELKRLRSIVAFDDEWQHSDLTERQALSQALKLLPEVPGVMYFGFPWATLIEHLRFDRPQAKRLKEIIEKARPLFEDKQQIITVSQHPDMLKYQDIFADAGLTHVFWPYAREGVNNLPAHHQFTVLPMPFASIKALSGPAATSETKRHLFAYIEPENRDKNSNEAKRWILDHLKDEPRGLVIAYDQWNFSITQKKAMQAYDNAGLKEDLGPASIESWRILQDSLFSLCPAELGANLKCVWESIGSGAIPVVISNRYCLPGDKALWEEAIIFCPARMANVLELPQLLQSLACDKALLRRKQHALRQLWMLYGPDCFVYDIQKLFLSIAQKNYYRLNARAKLPFGRLLSLAIANNREKDAKSEHDAFLLGCSSRVLSDPSGFVKQYKENAELRQAYKRAMISSSHQYVETMLRNLTSKGLVLE